MHNLKTTASKRNPDRRIISEPVAFSNGSFINDMAGYILNEIAAKAAKEYPPGFTLIIQCSLNHLYLADEWIALVEKVRQDLPQNSFGEVWMCDGDRPDDRKAVLLSIG